MPCLLRILFYIGKRSSLYANPTRSTNQHEIPIFVGLEQSWCEILCRSGFVKEKSKREDLTQGFRGSEVVGKAWEVTISMTNVRWHPCRGSPELSNLLLPPRGQDTAANGQQYHNAPALRLLLVVELGIPPAAVELIAVQVGGGIVVCPLCFQISREITGRMQISSILPKERDPGKCNSQTSSPWT